MKFENKYRLLLYKTYLDTGLGLTYYIKYLIALFGIMSLDFKNTAIIILLYAILSFFLGYLYFKYKWVEVQNEVGNRFNLFVKEMRKSVNRKT